MLSLFCVILSFWTENRGKQVLQNDTDVTIGCLRGWKEPECQTCIHGWRKPHCDACAPNFGPPGECTSCLTGWAGENCDYCEGFGFSEGSVCTECIENGRWVGTLTLYLTFEPPECINLIPGMDKRTTINNKIKINFNYRAGISLYFHIFQRKTLPMNEIELTVPNL